MQASPGGFYPSGSWPCCAHSTGNTLIASASVGPALARPSSIASTVAGASSVSLNTRETLDGLIFSALAISLMVASWPVCAAATSP